MLSFGKPFIYEGNEFNHSKKNDANSYRSPLSVNSVEWEDKRNNMDLFRYTKELIKLRKEIQAFKYTSKEEINKRLRFIDGLDESMIGYTLDDSYLVIMNANKFEMNVEQALLKKYIKLNKTDKIEKIFDKEGKNNIGLYINEGLSVESLSMNVYKIGENNGL